MRIHRCRRTPQRCRQILSTAPGVPMRNLYARGDETAQSPGAYVMSTRSAVRINPAYLICQQSDQLPLASIQISGKTAPLFPGVLPRTLPDTPQPTKASMTEIDLPACPVGIDADPGISWVPRVKSALQHAFNEILIVPMNVRAFEPRQKGRARGLRHA